MSKYIDADKIRSEVERIQETGCASPISVCNDILSFIDFLQQEQPEVDLEKFTQKMNDWKARYNHPDNIPIRATMAFTARMFYMYPNVAREWYNSLPKVTQD